jgi:hypothetical protein
MWRVAYPKIGKLKRKFFQKCEIIWFTTVRKPKYMMAQGLPESSVKRMNSDSGS